MPSNAPSATGTENLIDIDKWLAQADSVRAQASATLRRRLLIVGGVLLVIAAVAVLSFGSSIMNGLPFLGFGGLVALALGMIWSFQPLSKWQKTARTDLLRQLAAANDLAYSETGGETEIIDFRKAELLPNYDTASLTDRLTGEYMGVDVDFMQVRLQERRQRNDGKTTRTEYVTVFNGLTGRFSFHKQFSGRTLILSDFGSVGNWLGSLGRNTERVRLEDPEFEKVFEVYGSDQIEARRLLTPAFMQRLLELHRAFEGRLQAAFIGEELLISVHGRSVRAPQLPMFGSLQEKVDLRAFSAPIQFSKSVVEDLKLDQRTQI